MSSHRSKPAHYEEAILGITLDEIIGELPYWLGAAFKYVWRAEKKNGAEDIIKALDVTARAEGKGGLELTSHVANCFRSLAALRHEYDLRQRCIGLLSVRALLWAGEYVNLSEETRENNDFFLYRSLSRYLVQLHWEEKKEVPSLNEEGN